MPVAQMLPGRKDNLSKRETLNDNNCKRQIKRNDSNG